MEAYGEAVPIDTFSSVAYLMLIQIREVECDGKNFNWA